MYGCCKYKEGSKVNQIFFAILINIPVFSYGTAMGWMSPMSLLLQSKNSPRSQPLTDQELSWMASACYITCVPSNFLFAYTCDHWGRKMSALLASFNLAACWAIKLCSTSIYAFVLARAMMGVAMAGCYIVSLLYIKEISEDCIRGALGVLGILSQTVGNLLLYILGDVMSYRPLLWFCLSIPTLHFVVFMMMPESPAYLIKRGKNDEAVRVLSWLRSRKETDSVVTEEIQRIQRDQEYGPSNKFVFKTVWSDKILRRAFFVGLTLTLAREACGAIPVLNFAGDIFLLASEGDSSFHLSPNQQAMVLGAVQIVGSMLAAFLVEKTGRKPLLIVSSAISGIGMCTLATWFLIHSLGYETPEWFPVTALCVCIFCDASGLQPVCFVVLSELFAYQFRGSVMAVTLAIAAFTDFLQMLFFKGIVNSIGIHTTFYLFGAVCLLATVYIRLFVPETKMKSTSEIYEHLKTKKERTAAVK